MQAFDFVVFLTASLDRALLDGIPSNTWHAHDRRPLSEPTLHLRACPLASDRVPPSQTFRRNPAALFVLFLLDTFAVLHRQSTRAMSR
jgi:hypothetical protein